MPGIGLRSRTQSTTVCAALGGSLVLTTPNRSLLVNLLRGLRELRVGLEVPGPSSGRQLLPRDLAGSTSSTSSDLAADIS